MLPLDYGDFNVSSQPKCADFDLMATLPAVSIISLYSDIRFAQTTVFIAIISAYITSAIMVNYRSSKIQSEPLYPLPCSINVIILTLSERV